MTYKGHSVFKTLIRCRFSPAHSTGQKFIYTGCGTGAIKSECSNKKIILIERLEFVFPQFLAAPCAIRIEIKSTYS